MEEFTDDKSIMNTDLKNNDESNLFGTFLKIIRHVVLNELDSFQSIQVDLDSLYTLSKAHDMTHFVGYSIIKGYLSVNKEDSMLYQNAYYQAIRRVAILNKEREVISNVLSSQRIDFIALKGDFLRKIYPEDWMRMSSDIDLLVRKDSLNQAMTTLIDLLGCKYIARGAHHMNLITQENTSVELHFVLTEHDGPAKQLLDKVWNSSSNVGTNQYEYAMNDEMFYLFHMYHMSDHFRRGGCGIKSVLDTWVLNHFIEFNRAKRRELLDESGLTTFADEMERIAEKWFTQCDVKTLSDVESFILAGGVNGASQRVDAILAQSGNRKAFLMFRFFPPYYYFKNIYPILNHFPFLLPFCWIHRICKALISGKAKLAKYEINASKDRETRTNELSDMFIRLGLL